MPIDFDPEPLIRKRLEMGLTKTDVAKALNVGPMTVHRIEAGENKSPHSVKKYADYLGIKMKRVVK